MEELGCTRFDGITISNAVRKKRSQTSRRPRPDSQPVSESHDPSSLSSTPPSDELNKVSSDENTGYDTSFKRKEFNLNQCDSRVSFVSKDEDENPHKKIKRDDGGFNMVQGNERGRNGLTNKRCSEGVLAPANWKCMSKVMDGLELKPSVTNSHSGRNGELHSSGQSGINLDVLGNENKVKKVKLKVGGVTRTIHTNSASNNMLEDGSSTRNPRSSDAIRPRKKLILQGDSDDDNSPPSDKNVLQGIPWKDFSSGGFSLVGREDSSMGKISGKSSSGKQGEKSEPVRKSKRAPKKRALDPDFDDDDEDAEIRYLEKLKTFKVNVSYKDDAKEQNKKERKNSRVSKIGIVDGKHDANLENADSRSGKDLKKPISDRLSDDTDYEEEDEPAADCQTDCDAEGKKPRKESLDLLMDSKREISLTTRQRALHFGKDASSPGASLEFPNGLPPAPSRKQKEKLSAVEQQLKKAEAAQRRKIQNEKAARESEAEAIRKILGQDSSRKKREDKLKKRQEELAQERAENAHKVAPNTIRCVTGPTGTVVTFANNVGLPSIFDSKPVSYPPPRENCAGPSCTNPYKYRDSKSKLPLCSLQCYKAVQEKMMAETTS